MRILTATSLAIAAIVVFAAIDTDPGFARGGGRGGGGGMSRGGGGGGGFSRGGGGGFSAGGGGIRSGASTSISRGSAGTSSFNRGGAQAGGVNRANVAGGNRNISGSGNRINTGDINVNNGWNGGWGGWADHPVGAGLAVGAVAGVTAAAIGSTAYALPPSCSPYPYGGYSYYSCGGTYYQPQYEGDTVTYVTVENPAG